MQEATALPAQNPRARVRLCQVAPEARTTPTMTAGSAATCIALGVPAHGAAASVTRTGASPRETG